MQLFIKYEAKTITIEVGESVTANVIKQKIYEKERYPIDSQRVIISGNDLQGEEIFETSKLCKLASIFLMLK